MSVVPLSERTPRIPTAMMSEMPSSRRSIDKSFRKWGTPGPSLTNGVPQDDVGHEAPLPPSLVGGQVHGEVEVELPERGRRRRRVAEDVPGREVIGDPFPVGHWAGIETVIEAALVTVTPLAQWISRRIRSTAVRASSWTWKRLF